MKTAPEKRRARELAGIAMGAGVIMMAAATPVAAADNGSKDNGFLEKVERWQDSMSDKFRDAWRKLRSERGGKASVTSASVDLREQDQSYTVRLNLPGRDLDKVQIKLEGERLRIIAPADKAGSYDQTVVLAGVEPGAEPRIERRKDDDLIVVTVPKKPVEKNTPSSPDDANGSLFPLSDWESDVVKSMESMRREMDRIFEESFREFRLSPEHKGGYDHRSFGSFIDLKEEGSNYVVTAYLPERDVKNVNATIEGRILKFEASAEDTPSKLRDDDETSVTRRAYYSQQLTLPGEVKAEQMTVERKEGVLKVVIPKRS
jgi:HSP20 family molecular chaperone IbpA